MKIAELVLTILSIRFIK